MPNIVEYNATSDITPSDKGIQAAETAGRRIGQFAEQAGSDLHGIGDMIEQHENLVEVSHLARHMSDGEAALGDSWSQITSDPAAKGQPHLASTFMKDHVEPFIEEMQGLAKTSAGKEYALQTGDRIRQTLWRQTQGDQAAIDGAAVQENAARVGNNATVSVAGDPTQTNFDAQAKQIQSTADVMASAIPTMPGEADRREQWRQQYVATHMHDLVVSRYKSLAQSVATDIGNTGDPSASQAYTAAKAAYAGDQQAKDWVDGDTWTELGKGLDDAVRQGQQLYQTGQATQHRKESDDFNAALIPIETSLFTPNGAGGVTMNVTPDALAAVQQAAQMPGARQHPEKIEALLNAMHTATQDQISGKETVTDRSAYMALTGRVGSTSDPLTKAEVDAARADHKLSNSDYAFLRESASDSKQTNPKVTHALTELHQAAARLRTSIVHANPTSGDDPGSVVLYGKFQWVMEDAFRKAVAAGHDPEKAVQGLTDPNNPRGMYGILHDYQATGKQSVANILKVAQSYSGGSAAADPKAAKKGEDMDAWLARTGSK